MCISCSETFPLEGRTSNGLMLEKIKIFKNDRGETSECGDIDAPSTRLRLTEEKPVDAVFQVTRKFKTQMEALRYLLPSGPEP